MKFRFIGILLGLSFAVQASDSVIIQPHKNVEVLGLLYTLYYENPESSLYDTHNPDWAYGNQILKNYGSASEDPKVIEMLHKIGHLWISDLFPLMLQIKEFPKAKLPNTLSEKYFSNFSPEGNAEEGRANAQQFISTMNYFYKSVNFDHYWEANSKYYQKATEEAASIANKNNWIEQAESYYQFEFDRYQFIPSLSLPPAMGFATIIDNQPYALITTQAQQKLGVPYLGFDHINTLNILVHEWGHSLLASSFYQLSDSLMAASAVAFEKVQESMKQQNYLHWKAVLNEYFVRAGEVNITRMMNADSLSEQLYNLHLKKKNFIYLPVFVETQWTNYRQGKAYLHGMEGSLLKLIEQYKLSLSETQDEKLTIEGVVLDLQSSKALPFVNIGVRGKNVGTISKEDGTFELQITDYDSQDSLRFSMVGYYSYSISLADINSEPLEVSLAERTALLKEVTVTAREIDEKVLYGRKKKTKTTRGQSNTTSYGTGAAYGIKIIPEDRGFMLEDVNFHMRFNNTDSILFRINILSMKEGDPAETLLTQALYMKSFRGQKWIHKDFSKHKIIIDQPVLISYEVVKVWFSNKTRNNIFFTFGKGYEEGGKYIRKSSFADWQSDEEAFPIALYVRGRAL